MLTPSLLDVAATGRWQELIHVVVRESSEVVGEIVLVGHSGAGPLLPVIANELRDAPGRVVFVDTGVPPERGVMRLVPDEFLVQLRELATDGWLPKWSEWFGPDAMTSLVPDAKLREAIVAEIPRLPLSYFEQQVPMPDDWARLPCAYVRLSEAYRRDADEARSRGWPTVDLNGAHLDIATRPSEIADVLLDTLDS